MRQRHLYLFVLLVFLAPLASANDLPRRAWLGAGFQPLPDSVRAQMPDSAGARVVFLADDSPAQTAGIQLGDILLTLDSKAIRTGPQVTTLIKDKYHPHETLQAELVRNGERLTKSITLAEAPREHPADFDVLYESFTMDDALRRTIITKPRTSGKFPVVVMCGGLGCYSLDNATGALSAYNEVLYALTRAGFATVRIEKTGMGDSQGKPCADQDFDYEVQGLIAGIRSLANYPYLDTSRIILYGHSMGGFTAPCVAQVLPVQGIVAQSTSAIGWFEYMLTNQRRQLVLEGIPYDSIEAAQFMAEKAYHQLYVEQRSLDDIVKEHPEYGDFLSAPAHYTFMQDVANLNVAEKWKQVTGKVLFIYGSSDFVTARDEHLYGVNVVNSYHPGHAEYAEIDDMDHYFLRVPDQQASFDNLAAGMPIKTMNRDVIPVIVNWCRDVAGMNAHRGVER